MSSTQKPSVCGSVIGSYLSWRWVMYRNQLTVTCSPRNALDLSGTARMKLAAGADDIDGGRDAGLSGCGSGSGSGCGSSKPPNPGTPAKGERERVGCRGTAAPASTTRRLTVFDFI